jgi:hypothetical protein
MELLCKQFSSTSYHFTRLRPKPSHYPVLKHLPYMSAKYVLYPAISVNPDARRL